MAIDNDEVQRLLEDMRLQNPESCEAASGAINARERKAINPDLEVLEAVANNDTMFRAVELRRAELQRGGAPCSAEQSEPGSGAKVGPSTAAGEAEATIAALRAALRQARASMLCCTSNKSISRGVKLIDDAEGRIFGRPGR